ncbi:glycosyltransferase family 29 protein [Pontibacter sp. BT731]|uniref:glycosyltransferase family 29 protein n=1 Tax=Pontibacter coccineus TaxID=3063328 RepID=UPI0026E33FF2|nr:glycosyltransferase family 29 protein [Pontibacter sp. BT731]MDO6390237.1 glycosyltransferase family 29 protein [Pontibacter sp. BT731]
MTFINKLGNAVIGLLLMSRNLKIFDSSVLTNKRIAVVGPASSAYNTNNGKYIDGFDFIVRINKAPDIIKSGRFQNDIGTRTDILFHSFFENEFSGGGPLNFNLFNELEIKYVINPIPGYFGRRTVFNFYKKYLKAQTTYLLPKKDYDEIKPKFGAFRPTTGFSALQFLMNSNFKELYITGFTFFKTAYGDGYRDELKDVKINTNFIASEKQHDPDIEFREFKRLLQENAYKNIRMDSELVAILNHD